MADAVLQLLSSLSVDEAADVISSALTDRPELARRVVHGACPELTYAPAKALTNRRAVGRIKSFSFENGYGFIECSELRQVFGSDVFLRRAQIGDFSVDQDVSFAVLLNREHKPQAFDLQACFGTTPCPASSSASLAAAAVPATTRASAESVPTLYGVQPSEQLARSSARQWLSQELLMESTSSAQMDPGPTNVRPVQQWLEQRPSARPQEHDDIFTRRFVGRVKSFSSDNGFGFIECKALHKLFHRDVFVHRSQIADCKVGMEVSFNIFLNSKGQPQAACLERNLACEAGMPGDDCSGVGAADESSTCKAAEVDDAQALVKAAQRDLDSLFEGAICIICQEVMHRATSIQPCLHSFCSHCLGSWLQRQSGPYPDCPVCRSQVLGVSRNHTLDGLINGLLKAHPSKRRSAQELDELDEKDILAQAGYNVDRVFQLRAMSDAREPNMSQSDDEDDELYETDEDVWLPLGEPILPTPYMSDNEDWERHERSTFWLTRRRPVPVNIDSDIEERMYYSLGPAPPPPARLGVPQFHMALNNWLLSERPGLRDIPGDEMWAL